MWNWIKNLFKRKVEKDPHEEMYEREVKEEYSDQKLSKMTKGDLKKLHAQGKIPANKLKF